MRLINCRVLNFKKSKLKKKKMKREMNHFIFTLFVQVEIISHDEDDRYIYIYI